MGAMTGHSEWCSLGRLCAWMSYVDMPERSPLLGGLFSSIGATL